VGAGRYHQRVPESGSREFVVLSRGFNQMAERLAHAEARRLRLESQLAALQEEERAELARDLHDEIGPLLFAVGVDLSVIQQDPALRGTDLAIRVEAVRESLTRINREIKAILGRLRQNTLVDLGLRQAVENLLAFWRTRYPRIQFDLQIPEEGFSTAVDNAIYHVIMESLSNALRHGNPSAIGIAVTPDADLIEVEVTDDGSGLSPKGDGQGFGMINMDERVRALGGTLTVQNRRGGGVSVAARIPVRSEPVEPLLGATEPAVHV
jgi:two-component system, NarL family, sensor histidine kinase UhpB